MSDAEFQIDLDVDGATNAINNLINELKKVQSSFLELGKNQKKLESETKKSTSKIDGYWKKIREGQKKATESIRKGFKNVAIGAAGLGASIFGAFKVFESFAGIVGKNQDNMQAFSVDGEKGAEVLKRLRKASENLGISQDNLIGKTKELLHAFESDAAEEITMTLADVAAMTGKGEKSFVAMSDEISNLSTKSGLVTKDLQKFAQTAGVNFDEMVSGISQATGKSVSQIKKELKRGTFDIQDMTDGLAALATIDGTRGARAAAAAMENPADAIVRLGNIWENFKTDIATELFTPEVMEGINSFISTIKENIPKVIGIFKKLTSNSELLEAILIGVGVAAFAVSLPFLKIIAIFALIAVAVTALIYYWDDIKNAILSFVDVLTDVLFSGLKLFIDRWESVLEFLGSLPGKFLDFGKDIINGLLDGLKWGYNKVKQAVSSIGNLIPDTVKKILGIASPSRVFRSIGRDTAKGFVKGIGDEEKKIEYTVERMVDINSIVPNHASSSGAQVHIDLRNSTFSGTPEENAQSISKITLPALSNILQKYSYIGTSY